LTALPAGLASWIPRGFTPAPSVNFGVTRFFGTQLAGFSGRFLSTTTQSESGASMDGFEVAEEVGEAEGVGLTAVVAVGEAEELGVAVGCSSEEVGFGVGVSAKACGKLVTEGNKNVPVTVATITVLSTDSNFGFNTT
jgi:hypothetical protein